MKLSPFHNSWYLGLSGWPCVPWVTQADESVERWSIHGDLYAVYLQQLMNAAYFS
jgi:hypothetical protein